MCVSALGKEGRTLSHLHKSTYCIGHKQPSSPPMSSCWPARGHPCGDGGGVMACRHGGWVEAAVFFTPPTPPWRRGKGGSCCCVHCCREDISLRPLLSNRACPENVYSSSSEEGDDSDIFSFPLTKLDLYFRATAKKTKHDEKQSTANDY